MNMKSVRLHFEIPPHYQSLHQGVQERNKNIAENVVEMKRTVNDLTELLMQMAHRQGIPLSPKPVIL